MLDWGRYFGFDQICVFLRSPPLIFIYSHRTDLVSRKIMKYDMKEHAILGTLTIQWVNMASVFVWRTTAYHPICSPRHCDSRFWAPTGFGYWSGIRYLYPVKSDRTLKFFEPARIRFEFSRYRVFTRYPIRWLAKLMIFQILQWKLHIFM